MGLLDGKVAVVTGGGQGIGEAGALQFAKEGAALVVVDLNGANAQTVAKKIIDNGGRAKSLQGDLTKPEVAEEMVALALSSFGRLDCALNNIGGVVRGADLPLHENKHKIWDANMRLNIGTTYYAMHAELPPMIEQRSGSIVNISSLAGLTASPRAPSYIVAKHGVVGITKACACDYAEFGIRVNCICPGAIDTPGAKANFEGYPDWRNDISQKSPMKRVAQPREIGDMAVWLCTDQASYVNATVIPIDGGSTGCATSVVVRRKE